MCALDGFHVEVEDTVFLSDRGIAGVGERAGDAVAQAGDIVLVAAEVLAFRGSAGG